MMSSVLVYNKNSHKKRKAREKWKNTVKINYEMYSNVQKYIRKIEK